MRFMTGNRLRDHVQIKPLLEKTTLTPVTPIIKSKDLKLYGHKGLRMDFQKYSSRVWLRERGIEVDHVNGVMTMYIFGQI